MTVLFVYGTLKRGDCRHRLLEGQRFLGEAETAATYRLFDLGDYPGLVESPGGVRVAGELYEVADGRLTRIDAEEGVAEGLYRRASVRLVAPPDRPAAETYLYNGDVSERPELPGVWTV